MFEQIYNYSILTSCKHARRFSSSMLICKQSTQPYYSGTGANIPRNNSSQILHLWLLVYGSNVWQFQASSDREHMSAGEPRTSQPVVQPKQLLQLGFFEAKAVEADTAWYPPSPISFLRMRRRRENKLRGTIDYLF